MRALVLTVLTACHHPPAPVEPVPPLDPLDPPSTGYRQPREAPRACYDRCMAERQMQAVAIETIEAGCRHDCDVPEDPR